MPSFEPSLTLNPKVDPDGVPIVIRWDQWVVGASVFIPAINIPRLMRQMRKIAQNYNVTFKAAERIENGKLGVRFWRMV